MYSEDDINSAVAAGALSANAAASFRAHMSRLRETPRGDEENFKLINSFNDIFVAIGIVIMLLAAGAVGQAIAGSFVSVPPFPGLDGAEAADAEWAAYQQANSLRYSIQGLFGGLLVAATSWPLAEFFVRRRRMALPSIILLLSFVGASFATAFSLGSALGAMDSETTGGFFIAGAGVIATSGTTRALRHNVCDFCDEVPIPLGVNGDDVSMAARGPTPAPAFGEEYLQRR